MPKIVHCNILLTSEFRIAENYVYNVVHRIDCNELYDTCIRSLWAFLCVHGIIKWLCIYDEHVYIISTQNLFVFIEHRTVNI